MAKVPHGFDVGIYWLSGVAASQGSSTLGQLKSEIRRAYEGERDIPYEAFNVIHSGGDTNCWGEGASEPPLSAGKQVRINNNAEGWIEYLKTIRDITAELGIPVGHLRGTISRDLCGMHEMIAKPPSPDTFPLGPWTIEHDITPYVKKLCERIVEEGLKPYVAGWFFGNEVYTSDKYLTWNVAKVTGLAWGVQTAQLAVLDPDTNDPCNFPYYWAEFVTTTGDTSDPNATGREFWTRNTDTGAPWDYEVPDTFKDWVNAFPFTANPDTAKLIFQPHYYPWGTPLDAWRYDKTRDAAGPPPSFYKENPSEGPWRVWSTILDAPDAYTGLEAHAFRTKFLIADYPKSQLEFQPKFELNRQASAAWPGHVDAHKVIRVQMNMRRQWSEVREDDRMTGFWIMIWNQAEPLADMLWHQWTETAPGKRRYAEAVQNEFGAGTEGLPEVWMEGGQLITTRIKEVVEDPSPKPPDIKQGFYVKYHIAPTTIMQPQNDPAALVLGEFDLGKRSEMEIQIVRTDLSSDVLVRTITEGYEASNYPSPRYQPHGRFEVQANETATDPLLGTCAYWDGLWDNGPDDGKNAPGDTDPPVQYRADLVINGFIESSLAFEKTA